MYKIAKPFFVIVETPLHAGSGQEPGIVDMPIQRERHTGFPKIEGSGLKGSIREVFEELKTEDSEVKSDKLKEEFPYLEGKWEIEKDGKKLIKFDQAISLAFGPEEGDAHAGALGFTDARLLLFPVKSMKGVFAWITCPMVLERFKKELELCKNSGGISKDLSSLNDIPSDDFLKPKNGKGKCIVADKNEVGINGNVILEEYAFEIQNNNLRSLAKFLSDTIDIPDINNKLVILSNEDFRDFVNLSTEVITRTKINNETGTVQSGALFTEEYLPAETVMYSLTLTTSIFNKDKGIFAKADAIKEEKRVMDFFEKGIPEVIQIGGNATIGKGIVRTKVWGDKDGQ